MARYVFVIVVMGVLLAVSLWPESEVPPMQSLEPTLAAPGPDTESNGPAEAVGQTATWPTTRAQPTANCSSTKEEQTWQEYQAEFRQQQDDMYRVLRASGDAEHLLAAALSGLREHPGEALRLAARAADTEPSNPLVASRLLEICFATDSCTSNLVRFEQKLAVADKANGLAWIQIAFSRLKRNDEAAALAALREAIAAAVIEDYYAESIFLFDRALAASTGLPAFERTEAAGAHAATFLNSGLLITQTCLKAGKKSFEWRDACLDIGERFEIDGRTMMIRAIGLELQMKMYEFSGDTRAQQETLLRQTVFDQERFDLIAQAPDQEVRDATAQRKFLEILASSGEMEALRYMADLFEGASVATANADRVACDAP
jgi:hypothetical protein